jgi:ParB family chromosome partitioning protein
LGAGDAATIELLADRVVRAGLSVRATEALVRARAGRKKGAGADEAGARASSASIRDLELRLTRALGTRVNVHDRGNKGEVVIPYGDLDALDRILDKLLGR